MSKIIKLALIILIVIVVVIMAASFYLIKNGEKILNDNKPLLEAKVSQILKTPVALGVLNLKVFPNAVVDIESLTIGKTSDSSGIAVSGVKLDVAILELLNKNLLIKELIVDSPSIRILKTKTGIVIDGLPTPKTAPGDKITVEAIASPAKSTSPSSEIPGGLEMALEKFEITNATIDFEDQVANKKFTIKPLSVGASVTLADSLVKLSGLSFKTDISGITAIDISSNEIDFDLKKQEIDLKELLVKILDADFKLKTNLNLKTFKGQANLVGNNLNLANVANSLTAFAPNLKTIGLSGYVEPNINLELQGAKDIRAQGTIKLAEIMSKLGLIEINKLGGDIILDGDFNQQNLHSNNLALVVGSAPATTSFKASLIGSKATLDNSLKIFGGTSKLTAVSNFQSKTFNTTLNIDSMDLGQADQALPLPILKAFSGTLNYCNLKANGALGANLVSSLNAEGDLLLTNGLLKGTNLPAKVLGAIKDLPFISGSLLDGVPANLQGEVSGEDTAIRELKTNFSLANSILKINSLSLLSTVFSLTSTGTIGLDKTLNLDAEITFNKEFSQALALKTKEIGNVLDANGRLVIPIQIKGSGKNIIIIPNLKRLIEIGATKIAKEKIEGKVKDALGEKGKDLLNKFGW